MVCGTVVLVVSEIQGQEAEGKRHCKGEMWFPGHLSGLLGLRIVLFIRTFRSCGYLGSVAKGKLGIATSWRGG